MRYVDESDLTDLIFPFVFERYGRIEEVPDYKNDQAGMPQLLGVLERAQNDTYYPTVLDKASYLLIGINKGHFFGNGNKQLALVTTIIFLFLNDKILKSETKEFYSDLLRRLFPEQKEQKDFTDFSPTDYATYNLSIAIADSGALGIVHDNLKERVFKFLEQATADRV